MACLSALIDFLSDEAMIAETAPVVFSSASATTAPLFFATADKVPFSKGTSQVNVLFVDSDIFFIPSDLELRNSSTSSQFVKALTLISFPSCQFNTGSTLL